MGGGYRDELKALQLRKEALETEVAELREAEDELEEARDQLHAREEQIQALQARLQELEDDPAPQPAPLQPEPATLPPQHAAAQAAPGGPEAPEPPFHKRPAPGWSVALLLALPGLLGVGAVMYFSRGGDHAAAVDRPPPATPPLPTIPQHTPKQPFQCTIDSTPNGAQVMGDQNAYVLNGGSANTVLLYEEPLRLGFTPLDVLLLDYTLTLQKPGYKPAKVTLKLSDMKLPDCRKTVVLEPQ